MARAMRSASLMVFGFGSAQVLRLISNLILARILFPEAFGLMSLVSVVIVGLNMFSDIGIAQSISQHRRGDQQDFLDTAWTIQIIRGALLFVAACLLAYPISLFYGEPRLAIYVSVAAIGVLINGFQPTRLHTANRHLAVGRVTVIELVAQLLSLTIMVSMAIVTRSVMALVLGGLFHAAIALALNNALLPGRANRFRWEADAANDLIHFGKWIFLSTAMGYLISQGDRAILGRFLTLDLLGIYNIGFALGTLAIALGQAAMLRVLVPIYRETSTGTDHHRRRLRLMRVLVTAGTGGLLLAMAVAGPALAAVMYDARYALAQPIIVLIALASLPQAIIMTYDPAALAAGDSRGFFVWLACRALAQTVLTVIGVQYFGVIGVAAALGVSVVLAYPALIWLATKHKVWDPLHDLIAAILFALATGVVLWLHGPLITGLYAA